MKAKKSVSMKVVVLLLAVVLLIGCVAGGTLAWLITSTGPVQNTFVAGNIGTLTLEETKGTANNGAKEFIIIPGTAIEKDPVVTFNGNNVAAYVFLKVDANGWTVTDPTDNGTTYTYSIGTDEGTGENIVHKEMKWTLTDWTELQDGIYYKTVAANAGTQTWHIIDNDTIIAESGITQSDLSTNSIYVKGLTFTAYAIQAEGHAGADDTAKAAAAWAAVKNS